MEDTGNTTPPKTDADIHRGKQPERRNGRNYNEINHNEIKKFRKCHPQIGQLGIHQMLR